MLVALRRIAEHTVADVQRVLDGYFHDRDSLDPVSRDELAARVRNGEVTVLDVRPRGRVQRGSPSRCPEHPPQAAQRTAQGTARRQGGHRLLPRPLLRLCLRSGCRVARARDQGATAGGRLSGMARRGRPGRGANPGAASRRASAAGCSWITPALSFHLPSSSAGTRDRASRRGRGHLEPTGPGAAMAAITVRDPPARRAHEVIGLAGSCGRPRRPPHGPRARGSRAGARRGGGSPSISITRFQR